MVTETNIDQINSTMTCWVIDADYATDVHLYNSVGSLYIQNWQGKKWRIKGKHT